ncbi:MAG TPA: hypothetical protein ACFYD2_03405 [Candidatus Avalokitesvara rifleensis]|nr:hypothetical protein [Candidatus Brocadiales bacterium]
MDDKVKISPGEAGEGGTPWFLKLIFLAFILWAVYYLWKNVQLG